MKLAHCTKCSLVLECSEHALYIPLKLQDIFSVKAAASQLGDVTFNKEKDAMQHRDGTKFHIYEYNRQHYLHTASDQCKG